jgi:serine/threonine protein kinase|eukprot:TRINITY_DN14892_c0_g1_i1.p1 TRINITY_DN14892_c0_g1~~TRINITY_DN14892_c0_g1_i1.p1  ORF type:complete len:331 (+),score=51.41 TRINITY_DN14892_c0_g1_i1:44-1036(+)
MGSPVDATGRLCVVPELGPPESQEDEDRELCAKYKVVAFMGEGAFGTVKKAVCRRTSMNVAIKKIRSADDEGVPISALREIHMMMDCSHINILRIYEVIGSQQGLYLVLECLDMDLFVYLKKFQALQDKQFRNAIYQCFSGIEYCHGTGILHRDVKPQNILVDVKSMRFVLADFGLARSFSTPLKIYTRDVVTLWYKAPEVLLGQNKYGPGLDIWALGCVMYQMVTGTALFRGDSEIGTIFQIFMLLGTPTEDEWPGVTSLKFFKPRYPKWRNTGLDHLRSRPAWRSLGDDGMHLLLSCLRYDLIKRPSAKSALRTPFLKGGLEDTPQPL